MFSSAVLLLCVGAAGALNVAVAGATGRTGRLVVDQLLQNGHTVTALTRDDKNAKAVLPSKVAIKVLDLGTASRSEMRSACADAERFIWCATGFTDAGESIDIRGGQLLPALDKVWRRGSVCETPSVIMLSSAGVTRPSWDDAKKERLVGASDIPIVRLNPMGILDQKCAAPRRGPSTHGTPLSHPAL